MAAFLPAQGFGVHEEYDPNILNKQLAQQMDLAAQGQAMRRANLQTQLAQQLQPLQLQQQQLETQKLQRELDPAYHQQLLNEKLKEIMTQGQSYSMYHPHLTTVKDPVTGEVSVIDEMSRIASPVTGGGNGSNNFSTGVKGAVHTVPGADGQIHSVVLNPAGNITHDFGVLPQDQQLITDPVTGMVSAVQKKALPGQAPTATQVQSAAPVAAAPGQAPGTPKPFTVGTKEEAAMPEKLAKDVQDNKIIQDYRVLEENLANIKQSVAALHDPNIKNKSGVKSAIYDQFQKTINPGGVVRATSIAQMNQNQSILDQLEAKLSTWMDSGGISPESADAIMNLASKFRDNSAKAAGQELGAIRERAKKYNIPEKGIIPEWGTSLGVAPSAPISQPSPTAGASGTTSSGMTFKRH